MSDVLLFIAAFFLALFTAWKISKEKLYSERVIFDAVITTSVLVAAGSRLVYVLFHFDSFGFNILKWIVIGLYPGLSIGGALIGFGAALWVLSDKKTVVPFPELADVLTRTFLFVGSMLLVGFFIFSPHPSMLYRLVSIVCSVVIPAIVFNKKRQLAPGTYSAVVWFPLVVGYFLVDFVNTHDVYYWKLSVDQWVYAVFILLIAIILAFQIKQKAFFKHQK